MEDVGIQDAKVADRVIHKAKRQSKALIKVNHAIYVAISVFSVTTD